MRMYEQRLRIGVANHANARTALELVKLMLEFGSEIRLLQTMDRAEKLALIADSNHTSTASAEM